jgi:hypothetical protein
VAAVTGLLWAGEPGLPPRTAVAFAGIVVTALRHRAEPVLFLAVLVVVAIAVLTLVSARSRHAALLRRTREPGDRRPSG